LAGARRLARPGDRLTGDAKIHAARWTGPIEALAPAAIADAELVVDALFGSGLSRALEENVALTLAAAGRRGVPLIAVDVPSGVMGDTGESCGAVAAQCTVTFTRKKPCHVLLPGRDLGGDVVVADIGTPASVLDGIAIDTWENDPALWRRELPRPASGGNKYSRGHALLVGGYPMTGAARMAARAAARAGAGLTSIAVPDIALPIYAGALTSIMVHPLSRPEDFTQLLGDPRYSALLIGPVPASTRPLVRVRSPCCRRAAPFCSMRMRSACSRTGSASWPAQSTGHASSPRMMASSPGCSARPAQARPASAPAATSSRGRGLRRVPAAPSSC